MLKTVTFATAVMIGSAAMAQMMPGSVDPSALKPNQVLPGHVRAAEDLAGIIAGLRTCNLSTPNLDASDAFLRSWSRTRTTAGGKPMDQVLEKKRDMSAWNAMPAIKAQACKGLAAQLPSKQRRLDYQVSYFKRCAMTPTQKAGC
jgi:hypothetical protein